VSHTVTFGSKADNEYGDSVPKGKPLKIRLGKWDPENAGQDPAVFDATGRFLGSRKILAKTEAKIAADIYKNDHPEILAYMKELAGMKRKSPKLFAAEIKSWSGDLKPKARKAAAATRWCRTPPSRRQRSWCRTPPPPVDQDQPLEIDEKVHAFLTQNGIEEPISPPPACTQEAATAFCRKHGLDSAIGILRADQIREKWQGAAQKVLDSQDEHRQKWVDTIEYIYAQHCPKKLKHLPGLLMKFNGREEELLSKVKRKYEKKASLKIMTLRKSKSSKIEQQKLNVIPAPEMPSKESEVKSPTVPLKVLPKKPPVMKRQESKPKQRNVLAMKLQDAEKRAKEAEIKAEEAERKCKLLQHKLSNAERKIRSLLAQQTKRESALLPASASTPASASQSSSTSLSAAAAAAAAAASNVSTETPNKKEKQLHLPLPTQHLPRSPTKNIPTPRKSSPTNSRAATEKKTKQSKEKPTKPKPKPQPLPKQQTAKRRSAPAKKTVMIKTIIKRSVVVTSPEEQQRFVDQIEEIYRHACPEKLETGLPVLLQKYTGREKELLIKVKRKYKANLPQFFTKKSSSQMDSSTSAVAVAVLP